MSVIGPTISKYIWPHRFIGVGELCSILNRVARRTKQSSQAHAAAGPSAEPLKNLIWSELRPPGGRRARLATQTEDIHRTLRSPLSSAAHRHRSIRSAGLWTAAGPRFRTCV